VWWSRLEPGPYPKEGEYKHKYRLTALASSYYLLTNRGSGGPYESELISQKWCRYGLTNPSVGQPVVVQAGIAAP